MKKKIEDITVGEISRMLSEDKKVQWKATAPYSMPVERGYNYKCPKCGGEFNYPSIDSNNIKHCPFCGESMYSG